MPDRFLDATWWGGEPLITFHGYDLMLDPTGGSQGDGLITGVFADGNAFAVHLRGDQTASRVRLAEIPEPSTLVIWSLLATVAIAAGRCRRRNVA